MYPSLTVATQDLAYDDKTKNVMSKIPSQSTYSAADILKSNQYDLSSINTVLLSHHHFDHIGNFSDFQPSTTLFLGPAERKPFVGDVAKKLQMDEKSLAKHNITFMSDIPKQKWIDVGCFKGIDFWGDGSFYVLSTPGVSPYRSLRGRKAQTDSRYIPHL